jgi:geranylgeranyl diphosphate synthase type II
MPFCGRIKLASSPRAFVVHNRRSIIFPEPPVPTKKTPQPGTENPELGTRLESIRKLVDDTLNDWLPAENVEPVEVHRAMRHSLFGGGKRIRPALALLTADALSLPTRNPEPETGNPALPSACALECVHTYSLVHDDLPAMDDDDLRRGRPTCHVVFGEATAILAGDALLTVAFEILARRSPPDLVGDLVCELAEGSGTLGMVGGQVLDMRSEATLAARRKKAPRRGLAAASPWGPADGTLLQNIHRWKTAALIRAAVRMGAISACASSVQLEAAGAYGLNLGLAFQVADDVLDVEGTAKALGKTPGKDAKAGKLTYPAVYGLEAAKAKARAFADAAKAALAAFPGGAPMLAALADLVVTRKS